MTQVLFVLLAAGSGVLIRTVLPYLATLKENPDTKFDSKFLVPPLVSCVIALFTLPLLLTQLPPALLESAMTMQAFLAIFAAAWGTTDIAREVQKAQVFFISAKS
jgi:hypothetical protein